MIPAEMKSGDAVIGELSFSGLLCIAAEKRSINLNDYPLSERTLFLTFIPSKKGL